MPRNVTRILITGMLLTLAATIVYVLSNAASGPSTTRAFERYATGPLAGLDFAYAGEVPEATPFTGPEGETVSLEGLQGKVILVNFWATWCAPCEREMPSLAALNTALAGDDFQVVAISVDNDEDKDFAISQLAKWTGGGLPFYHTSEFALTYQVGIRGFPTSILLFPGLFRFDHITTWCIIPFLPEDLQKLY